MGGITCKKIIHYPNVYPPATVFALLPCAATVPRLIASPDTWEQQTADAPRLTRRRIRRCRHDAKQRKHAELSGSWAADRDAQRYCFASTALPVQACKVADICFAGNFYITETFKNPARYRKTRLQICKPAKFRRRSSRFKQVIWRRSYYSVTPHQRIMIQFRQCAEKPRCRT